MRAGHPAREVVDDLVLTHQFLRLQVSEEQNPLSPVIYWHNEPDRGYNLVKVCTWDRAGLFRKIAGSFSAIGLNRTAPASTTAGTPAPASEEDPGPMAPRYAHSPTALVFDDAYLAHDTGPASGNSTFAAANISFMARRSNVPKRMWPAAWSTASTASSRLDITAGKKRLLPSVSTNGRPFSGDQLLSLRSNGCPNL